MISTPQKYRIKSKNSFEDRQKLYFDNKNKHQQKLINKIDKDFQKNCSFTQKINIDNYYLKNNDLTSPVHLRLYEDEQKRRNKKLNNYNSKLIKIIIQREKLVDYEKIEENK